MISLAITLTLLLVTAAVMVAQGVRWLQDLSADDPDLTTLIAAALVFVAAIVLGIHVYDEWEERNPPKTVNLTLTPSFHSTPTPPTPEKP